ncbi:MAG: NAD(P)H-dependent oxidoreductase subunit E [bacterium]
MSMRTLDPILKGRRSQPHQLIEVLQDLQEQEGYIPEGDMGIISKELGVPLIEVYRVAHFYKAFSLEPRGKNIITICDGTACHVRGSNLLSNQIKGLLGISPGETTGDRKFTLEQVNCLGACALGPIVVLNGEYHDHVSPNKLRSLINSVKTKKTGGKRRCKK